MYVVAIVRMGTSIDEEAAALASELGTHAYDERLKLAAGCPCVVLLTADAERAAALARVLKTRGHDALSFPASDVVPSSAMISLEHFRFDDDALIAAGLHDQRLPWSDMSTLVRATDRRRQETATSVKEKKLDLARTVITGGLIRSKTTQTQVSKTVDESEQVLFIFRSSGETSWLLREHGTRYAGLGADLSSSSATNFVAAVAAIRARAPGARYDDRLAARKRPHQTRSAKVTSAHDLDLLAHLIAHSPG